MSTQELQAKERSTTGSAAAKKMRRLGEIPAIAYGRGQAPRHLTLNNRELRHHLKHHGASGLLTLNVEGRDGIPTIIKSIQTNPVSHEVETVDFLRVSLTETIEAQVNILLEGEPIGVVQDGGILVQALHILDISALPQNLPEHITVDVSALELGGAAILVSDLEMPEGVTVITEGEEAVAVVNMPQLEPEPEEGEAVEGEEGEAVEGEDVEVAADEVPASDQSGGEGSKDES